jgi:hypothetical protein
MKTVLPQQFPDQEWTVEKIEDVGNGAYHIARLGDQECDGRTATLARFGLAMKLKALQARLVTR